jgi:hypothetical protein
MRGKRNTLSDFEAHVDRSGGPEACHIWTLGKDKNGYGEFKVSRVKYRAHRLAWELANGPIGDGLWVLHRCDNPSCVNPGHLFLGTNVENSADRDRKGRQFTPRGERHGSHTHPECVVRGDRHPGSKLTYAKAKLIREMHLSGWDQDRLAAHFDVSQPTVSAVIHRRRWVQEE